MFVLTQKCFDSLTTCHNQTWEKSRWCVGQVSYSFFFVFRSSSHGGGGGAIRQGEFIRELRLIQFWQRRGDVYYARSEMTSLLGSIHWELVTSVWHKEHTFKACVRVFSGGGGGLESTVITLVFAAWRFSPPPLSFFPTESASTFKLKMPTAVEKTERLGARRHTSTLQIIMHWSRLSSR